MRAGFFASVRLVLFCCLLPPTSFVSGSITTVYVIFFSWSLKKPVQVLTKNTHTGRKQSEYRAKIAKRPELKKDTTGLTVSIIIICYFSALYEYLPFALAFWTKKHKTYISDLYMLNSYICYKYAYVLIVSRVFLSFRIFVVF